MRTHKPVLLTFAFSLIISSATASFATPPAHLWSQRFGAESASSRGQSVAADAAGHVVLTGDFTGTVDFGGGDLSAQLRDFVLAKYDATGAHLWSHRFGGPSEDRAYSVAVDASGNILVTGSFTGTASVGGAALVSAGSEDAFVAKYDDDGNHLWSHRLGTLREDAGISIAAGPGGDVAVTGIWHGHGPSDIFVIHYDPDGNALWSKILGDQNTSDDEGLSVAVDGAGNVLVTGSFTGTVDFGGGGLVSDVPNWNIFIAKYAADGTHLWSQGFGDTGLDAALSIKADPSGNVLVTGYFQGSLSFGGDTLVSLGEDVDMFVAKLDPNGSHLWSRSFGGTSYETGYSLAVDGSSNVSVTGYFAGTANFGGNDLVSDGDTDIYFAEYDASGTHISSQRFGDSAGDAGNSIAVDGSGNRLMTGYFEGTVDFGGDELVSAGSPDMFIVKFGAVATGVDRGPGIRALSIWAAPNPFNPSTSIHYRISEPGRVTLAIYDVQGAHIANIVNDVKPAGAHRVLWRGRSDSGSVVPSGVYFARISHAGSTAMRKLVLLK